MARKRKGPWQRKQGGGWYTTVGRQIVKLGESDTPYAAVEAAYHAIHAKGKAPAAVRVAWLVDQFLDYNKRHRAATTYEWYSDYLVPFVAHVGGKLRVGNLTPAMVNRWIYTRYKDASPSCHHAAARCVVRLLNWAVAEKLIQTSPLVGFVKPSPSRRETAVTPAQYAKCLEHVKGSLRDAVEWLWHTGARPYELRHLEAGYVDGRKIVFPFDQSKGGKKRRVVYLDDTAAAIVDRLSAEFPEGPVFRNSKGRPWKKDALTNAFGRLRDKAGIEGLCPYSLRHGFATEALKRGTDTTTVGVLMGHSNPAMVAKVYQHLAEDDGYLLGVVNQLAALPDTPPIAPA